ncbi:MAG: hypothetical protein ABH850_01415 [Candidatus Micrarchaeota archaeon]
MKGFVISIDSMIALVIAFAMLVSITGYFSNSKFDLLNEPKLAFVSQDVLTVLEKNNKLAEAVEENQNKEIGKYLNKTSNNLCFELNIFDYDNNSSALSTATKKGCKKGNSILSTKRSFFSEEKFYWAELKSWYKVKT